MKSSTILAVAVAAGLSTVSAKAVLITGAVAFGGAAVLNNANPALATSVSVPLAFGATATGDFSPSIGVGTPIAFTSPLVDGVTSGLIWTGGAGPVFTFSATGPVTFTGADPASLAVVATGIVDDGPGGFDPTPAAFSMAVTVTVTGVGAFGSITFPTDRNDPLPDAGSALLLLGVGLVGVGVSRRMAV